MAEHHIVELLRKVARRANLKINGPHILRHTFCSHLAMRGAPTRAIQELAGHRDLTTTQRYMHLSPNAVVRCDSTTGSRASNRKVWRHCGDGHPLIRKSFGWNEIVVSPEGIEPSTNRLRVRSRPVRQVRAGLFLRKSASLASTACPQMHPRLTHLGSNWGHRPTRELERDELGPVDIPTRVMHISADLCVWGVA
jgi:hypothetical protein